MLEVQHIVISYQGKPILNDISFKVDTGETICLLGASGSGKSTLLRIIAGLEDPDSGSILFNALDVTSIPPHLRNFGLVFQDYALFPHLNVYENVAFGLKMRRLPQNEISQRVASALEMVNLNGFEKRQITDLSGGEQQRVALARALATRPRLLMFDEPLGALDRTLREDLLTELRSILHQTEIPAIYVTHDQEEAFAIANRVLILHEGRIIREGTPADVWENPESVYVAGFLGLGNIIVGRVIARAKDERWEVRCNFGILHVCCGHEHPMGVKINLLMRPQAVEPTRVEQSESNSERGSAVNTMRGLITDVIFQQDRFKVTFDNGLYVYLQKPPRVGEKIEVAVRVECLA